MSEQEPYEQFMEDVSTNWNSSALLKTLNYTFENSLTSASVRSPQPDKIKIPLRPHQSALIACMKNREEASLQGLKQGDVTTYTNFGIIGDSVGTGKSLVILSHIAQLSKQSKENQLYTRRILHPLSIPNFFSVYDKTFNDTSGNSLIVVPHTLFRQWQEYVKNQTTLSIFAVKSSKDIILNDSDKLNDMIGKADATLISNTLYSEFINVCRSSKIQWKRIFWDEADTMHIPGTAYRPTNCFNWFITATWSNFILEGHILRPHLLGLIQDNQENYHIDFVNWIKNELGITTYPPPPTESHGRVVWLKVKSSTFWKSFRCLYSLRGITVIRTSDAFLEESRIMPPIIDTVLRCRQPVIQKVINGIVSPEIQAMLHAGDIEGVLEELGVPANSPMSLLDAITNQSAKELEKLEKTLAFKETLEYSTPQIKENSLNILKTKIQSIKEKIKTLKLRLEGFKEETCPICFEEPNPVTVVPCCCHIFCGGCILSSLSRKNTCPLCRTTLLPSQLTRLMDADETSIQSGTMKNKEHTTKENIKDKLLTKPKQLLKFLLNNPTSKVLIFCRYENPFTTLGYECLEAGITHTILKGNKDCIANTIKQFENGEKRVLFLPTQVAGVGMNLIAATHVILLHVMTPEEEHQVIGRAYRLGRTDPLHVIRLLHDDEKI